MKSSHSVNFSNLVNSIRQINNEFSTQASRAVNVSLTLRNWMIGFHIVENELHGADRAGYGESLLSNLSKKLQGVSNCNRRQLYDYMNYYQTYPQIVGTVSAQLLPLLPVEVSKNNKKVLAVSAQSPFKPEELISRLSYSQFKLLVDIQDETKRAFYEVERN